MIGEDPGRAMFRLAFIKEGIALKLDGTRRWETRTTIVLTVVNLPQVDNWAPEGTV